MKRLCDLQSIFLFDLKPFIVTWVNFLNKVYIKVSFMIEETKLQQKACSWEGI